MRKEATMTHIRISSTCCAMDGSCQRGQTSNT
jgi:hypothetical protein